MSKFQELMAAFAQVTKAEKDGKLKDVPILGEMIDEVKDVAKEGEATENEFKKTEEQFKNWPPKE